jgi:hypothetical protein
MALAWGATLCILGLAWSAESQSALLAPGAVRAAGLAGLAAGQFVFMVLVADRWFPRASRRFVRVAEAITFGVFAVGLLAALALAWGGWNL